jgi:hypothetical protein
MASSLDAREHIPESQTRNTNPWRPGWPKRPAVELVQCSTCLGCLQRRARFGLGMTELRIVDQELWDRVKARQQGLCRNQEADAWVEAAGAIVASYHTIAQTLLAAVLVHSSSHWGRR